MAVSAEDLVPVVQGTVVPLVNELEEETDLEKAHRLMNEASELLKTNSHLFAYIGNPLLLRGISNRERTIIDKQLDRIYDLIQQLDDTVEEYEE